MHTRNSQQFPRPCLYSRGNLCSVCQIGPSVQNSQAEAKSSPTWTSPPTSCSGGSAPAILASDSAVPCLPGSCAGSPLIPTQGPIPARSLPDLYLAPSTSQKLRQAAERGQERGGSPGKTLSPRRPCRLLHLKLCPSCLSGPPGKGCGGALASLPTLASLQAACLSPTGAVPVGANQGSGLSVTGVRLPVRLGHARPQHPGPAPSMNLLSTLRLSLVKRRKSTRKPQNSRGEAHRPTTCLGKLLC